MKIVIPNNLGRNIGGLKKLILYLILMKGTCPDWPKIQFTKSSFSWISIGVYLFIQQFMPL